VLQASLNLKRRDGEELPACLGAEESFVSLHQIEMLNVLLQRTVPSMPE